MVQPSKAPLGELRFDRLAEIAVGETASVELCRVRAGPSKGQLVAVKRLHRHIAEDPQFLAMFRDEVWMSAALKHENVVGVTGWGNDEHGLYLAVELVRGVSMARLMKTVFETGERFTERQVVFLGKCICDGLAAAHSLRSETGEHLHLVHRDLTPGNVLLSFDGKVKITDFGLAKAKQRLTRTLTGLLKGQPQYMSPEQIRSQPLDGRSDIFALGVVLFELFSGHRPWQAANDLDAMRAASEKPHANLLELRPKIDKALVEVVNLCLEKDPASRYQSAAELSKRFDDWLVAHGYRDENDRSLGRFVRRNAMRQMRWFDRAVRGDFAGDEASATQEQPSRPPPPAESATRADVKRSASVTQATRASGAVSEDGPTRRVSHDDIDWGDDGPTLIQKGESAKESIRRALDKGRPPRPAAGAAAAPSPISPDTTAETRVGPPGGAPASPEPADRHQPFADASGADTLVSSSRGSGEVGTAGAPGVVVPHDPAAPPPPRRSQPPAPVPPGTQRMATIPGAHPESGDNYLLEAGRLASEASRTREEAQRASDVADAVAHASTLAGEAATLAARGDVAGARRQLAEARRIEGLVRSGQVPQVQRPSDAAQQARLPTAGLAGATQRLTAVLPFGGNETLTVVLVVSALWLAVVIVMAVVF
jgi:serine/threonine-protein kinase